MTEPPVEPDADGFYRLEAEAPMSDTPKESLRRFLAQVGYCEHSATGPCPKGLCGATDE